MGVTHYVWDPISDQITKEVDENGVTIAEYSYEPGPHGKLISQRRNGVSRFYHFDAQGNTRALTDENQNVTDTAVYTAFGEKVESTGTTVNPFGYQGALGYYTSSSREKAHVRSRDYIFELIRWMSKDPLWPIDGINGYSYVRNQPLTLSDPSGTKIIGHTPAYEACISACNIALPNWWQFPFRNACHRACGQAQLPVHGVAPIGYPAIGYGKYCGPFRAIERDYCERVKDKCGNTVGYRLAGDPLVWDELDMACAEHDCCLATAKEFFDLRAQLGCNAALCRAAIIAIRGGCPESMTPDDCVFFAGVILGSPFCALALRGPWPTPISPF